MGKGRIKQGVSIHKFLPILIILIPSLINPMMAFAQENQVEEFVYGITFFDGYLYGNAVSPPNTDTIYLIANVKNVIAPRNTMIYYWPLTNRYLADWESKNQLVTGTLEILDGNKLISTIELDKYLVQYDSENPLDTLKLHVGQDAEAAYDHFKELQVQYQNDMQAYHIAQQAYRDKVSELLESDAAKKGELTEEDFPDPPQSVPPMTLHSQTVAEGFVISLPDGTYHIRMRLPDGSIQPNSEKKLLVFAELEEGSSYNVVPESRWTKPEQSDFADNAIYTTTGATIYLTPFRQGKYNEYYYRHMEDPQDQSSRIDRNIWVSFEPLKNVTLEVMQGKQIIERLPLEGFIVQQLSGSAKGYEVVAFNPETRDRPSFEGYQIELGNSLSGLGVQLVDENNSIIKGSHRSIRTLNTNRAWIMYLIANLPFLVGVGIILERFRKIRRIKVVE
jgi:hypothetical protein